MTKQKMTIRQFLEEVIETSDRQDLIEFAKYRLEVMDRQNANRANKTSKKTEENLEKLPIILEILGDETMQVKEVRKTLEEQGTEVTSSKITAILKLGVEQGILEVVEPEKRSQPLRYKVITE